MDGVGNRSAQSIVSYRHVGFKRKRVADDRNSGTSDVVVGDKLWLEAESCQLLPNLSTTTMTARFADGMY